MKARRGKAWRDSWRRSDRRTVWGCQGCERLVSIRRDACPHCGILRVDAEREERLTLADVKRWNDFEG